jgi:hypothetical protein
MVDQGHGTSEKIGPNGMIFVIKQNHFALLLADQNTP